MFGIDKFDSQKNKIVKEDPIDDIPVKKFERKKRKPENILKQ
jgi:hypothetical protein